MNQLGRLRSGFLAGALLVMLNVSLQAAPSPVSYWPFDTAPGGVTPDLADSNPGTLVNSPTLVPSPLGNALSFDGATRYVTLGVKSNLNPPNAFSITVWVKPDAFSDP